jgi:DNA-binding NarL/FixJ family response regulator
VRNKIQVLLVDDHSVVRAGYRLLLSQSTGIGDILEADCGEKACELYAREKPGVVVMDLSMPGIGGLDTIRRICARDPSARILVFSIHDEPVYVAKAVEAGARGYITKSSAPDIMVEAVARIAEGQIYIEQGLANSSAPDAQDHQDSQSVVASLTAREFDIFILLARGMTVREIAEQLCIGYKTVANYSTAIKSKLGVTTGAELAGFAYELDLIKH